MGIVSQLRIFFMILLSKFDAGNKINFSEKDSNYPCIICFRYRFMLRSDKSK